MSETVQIGDATLYLGDCMDILPTLGKVDAVITDPPYGAKTHAGARTGGNGHSDPNSGKAVLIDFDALDDSEFLPLCKKLVDMSNRWVVMSCEWRHAAQLEASDLLVRLGVWIKPNGAPQFTGDRPGTGWEAIAVMHRGGRKRWNGGGHHAVWTFSKTDGYHPTGKPLPLLVKWVEQFTDVSETILDPFMGSGTTGVAAIQLGRKFIGIEREPKYFDIAVKRLEQAVAQGQLFAPEQPKQIQETFDV
jgi:site-specific DNA-methyltransferase (adenine-specific)